MTRLLACLLTVLLLFQSVGRELLVLHFEANQTELAARYCVNKAPAGGLAKVGVEVVAPTRFGLAAPAWAGRPAAQRYARLAARAQAPVTLAGVFHPPLVQG